MGAWGGPGASDWVVGDPAKVVAQPRSLTSCLGQTVTFTVGAGGAEPFTYQWYFQDVEVPGATTAQLTVTNLESSDAGNYHVTVSNQFGSATSDLAQLVVNDACVDVRMYAGLQIDGQAGATYVLKYTTDLGNPFSEWTPLGTNVMTSEGWFYLDMDSPFSPRRYYGIKLQP